MGKYNLDRLGNEEFENLVQALSTKIFNNQNIVFGSGRDGAREVTFDGKSNFGDGYHVIQAKYKDSFESKDWEWAKKQFKNEMKKFKDTTRDLPTPDVYVFFTNITFTPVSEIGGRDKIDELKKEYLDFIPNIIICGKDEIYKLLDNNRDVATTYASFIFSGDIISELYNHLEIKKTRDMDILYRFLNKEFEENLYSKLEQAGKVTDDPVNLDKVFVDLNILGDNISDFHLLKEGLYKDENEKFISYCLKIANKTWKKEQYKMVFIGGPGQGKSTVTQFLTQIYRVNFLKTFKNKTLSEKIENFQKQIGSDMQPKCYRFPINIILSDYSEWLSEQKDNKKSSTVLSYIQYRIEYRADENFSEFNNFRELLRKMSFLFIFDGLDEVPATSNRSDVIYEIDNFINNELKTVNCDALIIATTRPQGYTNEFSKEEGFKHFQLDDLDKETCLKYLDSLIKNTVTSSDDKIKQFKILKDTLENEVTANIMKTPLQATIMAILVKSGGKPSKDKFSLFDDYYKTMLKREKQKNVLKIIGEHEKYINEIHYKLGNRLQVSSQKGDNSSAYLDIDDFKILVEKYFEEQEVSVEDKTKYTNEIMEAITERLVFITENQDRKIGFAIRSTQEYFSAMKNVHNIREKEVIKNTKNISESIYWRNVFIFMLGYMMINKDYIIDENLDSYMAELNGSSLGSGELSLSSATQYGSLLSLEILSESILSNNPKIENKFIKHLSGLTNTLIQNDSYTILLQKLKSDILDRGLTNILKKAVDSKELYIRIAGWNNIAILSNKNQDYINIFFDNWDFKEGEEELFFLNLFVDNNIYSDMILQKYCKYLKWNYFDNLEKRLNSSELITRISQLDSNYFNEDIKAFLIEFLFLNSRRYSFQEKKNNKIFFKLLGIETDETLDSLKGEIKIIKKEFEFLLIRIKDLHDNKLLQNLYYKTLKYKKLSLLTSLFSYLLNPSSITLKKYLKQIESKRNRYNDIPLYNYNYNWQLSYIHKNINKKGSYNELYKVIENLGDNYEKCLEYEKKLSFTTHIQFFQILQHTNNQSIISYYENIYIKNKSALEIDFLFYFINLNLREKEDLQKEFSKPIFQDILYEFINIIQNLDHTSIRYLSLVMVISYLKEEDILELIDFKYNDYQDINPLNIFGVDKFISTACKKILAITNYKKENNLIAMIFQLLRIGSSVEDINLNILLEIDYKNEELKLFGYLSSLCDKTINTDRDKMKKITTFLLSNTKRNNTTIEYTLNIVENNKVKNDLAINLLFEMYKLIEKNSIENCLLASKYENYFKEVFENKVIEFE